MSCGGRVFKGDTVTISVPFEVDDYSNLKITYTTTGDSKIVKTQEEVEIEDGFITYTFEPGELDLLPDGVIYYTIECDVLGVPNVDSTNTNLFLKTPAGYSGKTAEDFYQEGYEAGLEDCSGSTPCNLQAGELNIDSGWTGSEIVTPSQGYDGFDSFEVSDNGYGVAKYNEGYNQGIAACGSELYSGYWCTEESWSGEAVTLTPLTHFASTAAGFSSVTITDCGYGQKKRNEGYKEATEYYKSNRRQYAYSGSVTFNRDYTYGNDKFGIFVYGEDFSGNNITKLVSRGYQAVDGEVIKDGDSWSAGTYGYVGMFEEETMRTNPEMKKGWVEPPIFFNQNDGSFNVRLVFIQ